MIVISENRKRSESITIRLTKTEKSSITAKAKKANMNLTEYIIATSNNSVIITPPDTTPILKELKRIGNNLNQLTAKVNSGVAYIPDLKELIDAQNRIYSALCKLGES